MLTTDMIRTAMKFVHQRVHNSFFTTIAWKTEGGWNPNIPERLIIYRDLGETNRTFTITLEHIPNVGPYERQIEYTKEYIFERTKMFILDLNREEEEKQKAITEYYTDRRPECTPFKDDEEELPNKTLLLCS